MRICIAALLLFIVATSSAQTFTFVTFAGDSTSGSNDGSGQSARFNSPRGVAAGANGTIYVADTSNHTIRKITASGVVSTLAGSAGSRGSADGFGSAARFYDPWGIAVDLSGNIWVTDSGHTIRRVTQAGEVTTVAGLAGTSGSADGNGSNARFRFPSGIAVDGLGNLVVADEGNYTIRRVTPGGAVSTIAGVPTELGNRDGFANSARFYIPAGVAIDASGNIYVSCRGNIFATRLGGHTIRKIEPSGLVTTIAGVNATEGSADGVGSAARFSIPTGLGIDLSGRVYIADTNNSTIRRMSPDAAVTTLGGVPLNRGNIDGLGSSTRFNSPWGVCVDRGNIYVADTSNHSIRKGSAESRLLNLSVRSNAGTGTGTLIVGFTLVGTGQKPLLIRGVGPSLVAFGLTGILANPTLQLNAGSAGVIAQNDDWESSSASITAAAGTVGAFALPASSRDSAILATLGAGSYTAQIGGGTGVALVEVYDAGGDPSVKLTNLSVRSRSGAGADILIAGFAITGGSPRTVLIRGIGPTLAQFGVNGALADPRVEIFSGAAKIDENDNWTATLASAFTSVGAFPLPAGSRDAALLVTLQPGSYTAQVSGNNNATGVALIEVYDVP